MLAGMVMHIELNLGHIVGAFPIRLRELEGAIPYNRPVASIVQNCVLIND